MSVVDVVGELSPPGIKNKVYSKAKCDKAQVVFNFFFEGERGGERQGSMDMGSKPPDSNPFLLGFLPYPFSIARY